MFTMILSLVTSFLLYVLLGLLILWCWYKWSHRELLHQAEKLPSVLPRIPILGSLYFSWEVFGRVMPVLINMWASAINKGASSYCLWFGPVPLFFTQDPDHIKKLLNSSTSFCKGDETTDATRWILEDGLLTAPVNRWKVTRRKLNPVFHPRNLKHMVSVINKNSRELVQNLSEHVDAPPTDIVQPLLDLSLKTICQLIFGPDVETKSPEFQGLTEFVRRIPRLVANRYTCPWLRWDFLFKLLFRKDIKKLDEIMKNFAEVPLKKCKEKYNINKIHSELTPDGDDNIKKHRQDTEFTTVVSVYNWMKDNLSIVTDKSLHQETATFYLAGTDTVATGLSTCMLALAQYQDMQDKVYTEITSVIGPDEDVTSEDLKKLPYTDQVIKETLRFATVLPFVTRCSTQEYQLGPCTVPPGTTIFLSIAGLHMDPKIYPEPHKFDPDRFSADKEVNSKGYTYIPFSGGPRNCIGKIYAEMLMKIILVHVLRKYKLSTDMDIHTLKKKFVVIIVSSEGYNVSFQERCK